jgi:hypothetical protein
MKLNSKIKPAPAVNDCPEGGRHSFIMGACFNCGLSIRVHKERVKEQNRLKWHTEYKKKRMR